MLDCRFFNQWIMSGISRMLPAWCCHSRLGTALPGFLQYRLLLCRFLLCRSLLVLAVFFWALRRIFINASIKSSTASCFCSLYASSRPESREGYQRLPVFLPCNILLLTGVIVHPALARRRRVMRWVACGDPRLQCIFKLLKVLKSLYARLLLGSLGFRSICDQPFRRREHTLEKLGQPPTTGISSVATTQTVAMTSLG